MTPREDDVTFNVVWTGTVYPYLRLFVASLIHRSASRFRFVANGCHPDHVAMMERAAARLPDRIVEVFVASEDDMVAHGVALDRVRAVRDDGPYFALVDPDIKANAPWVRELLATMGDGAAVTSGKEVWSDDNVVPVDHPGVAGEFFYDRRGFTFGSPHLAIYRRDALDATTARWGVGLGSAGPDMGDEAKARMASMGHEYLVYDTAKITNALIQGDGGALVHRDLPQLVHIGGLAHYLSPPGHRTNDEGEQEPDWARYEIMADRHEVTRYTARTLRALIDGDPPPPVPDHVSPSMEAKLRLTRTEVVDLVERYGRA